jgi:hypothetical protein
MNQTYFHDDIVEFLYLLYKHKVKYLIVGGEAVIFYGHSRLTGDIDIFYERTGDNTGRLFKMLQEFWDNDIPGIKNKDELMKEETVVQFGVPPNRVDIINTIESVNFNEAWINKKEDQFKDEKKEFGIYYIGLNELIKNKTGVNRNKDKEDLKFLRKLKE